MLLSNTEIIFHIEKLIGDNQFVYDIENKKWYSYDELWSKAYYLSERFEKNCLKKLVAIMENGINLFSLFFACMLSNVTLIPIDPHKSESDKTKIINEHSKAMLIDDKSDIFSNSKVLVDKNILINMIRKIDLNKEYMITYTSGSTGQAKGVVHCLKSLFLSAIAFGKKTGLNNEYTMCHVMPMTYMAGILNTIFMPFYFGCKIIILPRFDVVSAVSFWKNVEDNSINAFWLSPTMLNILMTVDRRGKIKDYLKNRKTMFFIGTAPLFENTRSKFEEKYGIKLLQSYGLSETLFISTEALQEDNDSYSVGSILNDVRISIYPDGEIGINVPWMFYKYSNEKTEDYFCGNDYMTGDLGEIKNNRLYITGRKKDLIVKGGMNISPAQIEKCIEKTGMVSECAVAGKIINDEENIICWYIAEFGKNCSYTEINKFIEQEIGRHCKVDLFIEAKEIPKNLNGKPDKQKLLGEI